MAQNSLHSAPRAMSVSAFNGSYSFSRASGAIVWLMLLLDRAKQRSDLSELTDAQLADIGVTRREAAREAGKWFWE
jgi:uncharacterized protein YjiS (DUF1127 family)